MFLNVNYSFDRCHFLLDGFVHYTFFFNRLLYEKTPITMDVIGVFLFTFSRGKYDLEHQVVVLL